MGKHRNLDINAAEKRGRIQGLEMAQMAIEDFDLGRAWSSDEHAVVTRVHTRLTNLIKGEK